MKWHLRPKQSLIQSLSLQMTPNQPQAKQFGMSQSQSEQNRVSREFESNMKSGKRKSNQIKNFSKIEIPTEMHTVTKTADLTKYRKIVKSMNIHSV